MCYIVVVGVMIVVVCVKLFWNVLYCCGRCYIVVVRCYIVVVRCYIVVVRVILLC